MANMFFGRTIKELRQRNQWTQDFLCAKFDYYDPVTYRLEAGEQIPAIDTMSTVKDTAGINMDEFITTPLEGLPMSAYVLHSNLMQALDNGDIINGQIFFDEAITLHNYEAPANKQFIHYQQARLMELQGLPYEQILPITLDALFQTYEDFDEESPGDVVLFFEEAGLFHLLAKIYANTGKTTRAIKIATDTFNGLARLPINKRVRDKQAVPILLTLANLHFNDRAFDKVVTLCEKGVQLSAERTLGKDAPDFALLQAKTLMAIGHNHECGKLLKCAFAGYILLGKELQANEAMALYRSLYGKAFETYGMEKLLVQTPWAPYKMGNIPACHSIGELIATLRKDAGITLRALAQGICSHTNLTKIEAGVIKAHMHYVVPLLERLGRDPELYCNFFLNRDDFESNDLRDEIERDIYDAKYEDAATKLKNLKKYKSYGSKANLFFVKRMELSLYASAHDISHDEMVNRSIEVMQTAWPDYNENEIYRQPLSFDEVAVVSRIAYHCMEAGKLKRASAIYEALIINYKDRCVDEEYLAGSYASDIVNLSACYGRMESRIEAMRVIEEGLLFCKTHNRFVDQFLLLANKGFNLNKRGESDLSLAHYALCFYAASLFNGGHETRAVRIAKQRAFELHKTHFTF